MEELFRKRNVIATFLAHIRCSGLYDNTVVCIVAMQSTDTLLSSVDSPVCFIYYQVIF